MTAYPSQDQITAARRSGAVDRHEPDRGRIPANYFSEADTGRAARARRLLVWCAVEFDADEARLVASEWAVARAMQALAELEVIAEPFKGRKAGGA